MIVISGALVLLALVLLVIGLLQHPLGYVYASIAVSLAAFGFLIVGVLQRRGEISGPVGDPAITPPPTFGAGTPGSNVVTTNVSRGRSEAPEPAINAPESDAANILPPATGATAATAATQQPYAAPEPPADDGLDSAAVDEPAGPVLIMPGRPRFHVAGCRYLLGHDTAEVDVRDARDEGFTPCGVCKPDEALGHPALDSPNPSSDGDDEVSRPPA